jgi:hypothetical protein
MPFSKLVEDWQYVVALAAVLVLSYNAKKYDVFQPFYKFLAKRIKSKRAVLAITSATTAVMPINGRTVISGGILQTLAPEDKRRKKFAVIDYLNAHHFYFWSPLEASVLLPMAALHITYWQFFGRIWPMLLTVVVCALWYTFGVVKEEDVDIVIDEKRTIHKLDRSKYLKEGALTVLFVALLNITGNILNYNSAWFDHFMHSVNKNGILIPVLIVSFAISWLLGSSEKFSGVIGITSTVFGVAYLPILFAVNWIGYILSPMHKCMLLGKRFFGADWKDYYKVLAGICAAVLLVASIHTFTTGL